MFQTPGLFWTFSNYAAGVYQVNVGDKTNNDVLRIIKK